MLLLPVRRRGIRSARAQLLRRLLAARRREDDDVGEGQKPPGESVHDAGATPTI